MSNNGNKCGNFCIVTLLLLSTILSGVLIYGVSSALNIQKEFFENVRNQPKKGGNINCDGEWMSKEDCLFHIVANKNLSYPIFLLVNTSNSKLFLLLYISCAFLGGVLYYPFFYFMKKFRRGFLPSIQINKELQIMPIFLRMILSSAGGAIAYYILLINSPGFSDIEFYDYYEKKIIFPIASGFSAELVLMKLPDILDYFFPQ